MAGFSHDKIRGADGDGTSLDPTRIDACFPEEAEVRKEAVEHEALRAVVGRLRVGTLISFKRPGEGQREGRIVEIPTEYCYRVRVADGKGDKHLAPGLVAVLWASHQVAVARAAEDAAKPEAPSKVEGVPTATPVTGKYSEAHWRQWVALVDEFRAKGKSHVEACRLANQRMECEHAPMTYSEAVDRINRQDAKDAKETDAVGAGHDRPVAGPIPDTESKTEIRETDMGKKHRTGPQRTTEYWQAFLREVVASVDTGGMTILGAVAAYNQAHGTEHTVGVYNVQARKQGIRPQATREQLISRHHRKSPAGRAVKRTAAKPVVPCPEGAAKDGVAPSAIDFAQVCELARRVSADVCGLLVDRPLRMDVAELIEAAADETVPAEIRAEVIQQAVFLVAAWQRGWRAGSADILPASSSPEPASRLEAGPSAQLGDCIAPSGGPNHLAWLREVAEVADRLASLLGPQA